MSSWEPSAEAIRALVELLPDLEKTPTTAWRGGEANEDGVISMPFLLPDEVESRFMDCAYKHGWVYNFDWGKWQGEAERYYRDADLLQTADVATIRKLITTHVRKERFCEGHFRAMREEGHLAAIARRLAEFVDEVQQEEFDPAALPAPDRSDQTPHTEKTDLDDYIDLFAHRGRFRDGRPYCKEAWAESGITLVTYFFSNKGLEGATTNELLDILEQEELVKFLEDTRHAKAMVWLDPSGNKMWSVNIVVGDEDGLYAQA